MKSLRSRKIRFVLSVLMIGLVAGSYESAKADLTLGEPTNLGAPVNSSRSEGGPDISADGLSLYFSSDRSGGRGGEDIWVATRPTQHDPWSTPVNLGAPVNSSASESFPCISADGLTLYFSDFFYGSARPGGRGGKDLWMSTRASLEDPWATPVNMGLVVNSSGDDVDPTTTVDGLTLIFASNRGGGGWNYNLYMSTRRSKADEWSTPVKLPPPVSGSSYSGTPGISGDGLALFFTSTRPGGRGQDDMWLTTRATLGGPWAAPVNLGAPINTSVLDAAPDISPDGRTLYWTSARPGGVGGYDLWQASVEPVFDSAWGSGSTAAINDYQFAGSATLTIHGQEKSADLLVTLLAEPQVDADGVQHVVATHTFTFADGSSFITSDQEVATPTATPGLYILTGIMDLASGTGMYEGVTGQLSVDGTIDFAAQPPAARFDMAGAIREDTTGVGATAAVNDYQFAGTATLTIHGQKKAADLLVTLLEPPVVDADGVQHVIATHKFTFADGSSFTTSDQEVATPTATPGLYILTGIMGIASGTGMYEGVTGRLGVNGTIDFAAQPPAAQFDIAGAVVESTTGSGATAAINDYQFAGTATLTIHGQEKSADLLVTLLEPPVVDADGVQYIKATHEFTFADGSSFITSDQEVATPTATPGLYTLTGIMDLASGTGMYEGVTGRLTVNGTIDFAAQPPAAQFEVLGGVSYCGDVNHPHPVGDLNQDCRVDFCDLAIVMAHWLEDNNP